MFMKKKAVIRSSTVDGQQGHLRLQELNSFVGEAASNGVFVFLNNDPTVYAYSMLVLGDQIEDIRNIEHSIE
jgi:hypothetical protein